MVLSLWIGASFAQEICNNAIDDDGDGLIDLNDLACTCSPVIMPSGVQSFIPNHSFEERMCCPYFFTTLVRPYLNCAVRWQQATAATSDYYHPCGFSPPSFPLPPPDGEAAVGFISQSDDDYKEYVGASIFDTPLHPGTEYTLSLWTAGLSISATSYSGDPGNIGVFYEGIYPLTLWGRTNVVPMPIGTVGCIGHEPGWIELGRVNFQPDNDWLYVSMTFTPPQEIKHILIGAPCDLPATYHAINQVIDSMGVVINMTFYPYTMVDGLMLTEAADQVLTLVTSTGRVCENNVVVTATPPAGATDHQWYRDGVALVGQTSTTLNVSVLGLGGGLYTMSSNFQGECLMGNTSVWSPRVPPLGVAVEPRFGCAPLEVFFSTTAADAGLSVMAWSLGDGATSTAGAGRHTYTSPGSYPVTFSIVTDEGCTKDTTVMVVVTGYLEGIINATPNPTDVERTTVRLSGQASSGDIITWWWDLGMADPPMATTPSLSANFPAEPGSYPVMLVVESSSGCVDTVRSVIVVTERGLIAMPNVLSPNGDGRNDRFVPLDYTGEPGLLQVYNRWGQMVFSTTALATGWDGRADGGDVPDGTYFYVVTPDAADLGKLTGHVTLVR